MKQINFETSKYDHKEELKTFLTSFNDLIDSFDKSFVNADAGLKKIDSSIEKKVTSIDKLNNLAKELEQRVTELKELKDFSTEEVTSLETKKKRVDFSDSEVQKMVLDDIDSEITAKKNKISKIDVKINATKEKIKTNNTSTKEAESELAELKSQKRETEESLYRTNALLKLIRTTKESFNDSVKDIITSAYIEPKIETQESVKTEDVTTSDETLKNEIPDDFEVVEYELEDMETPNVDIDEPSLDLTEDIQYREFAPEIMPTNVASEEEDEESSFDVIEEEDDYDFRDVEDEEINEEREVEEVQDEKDIESVEETVEELETEETETREETDYRELLTDIFNKEAISFSDFSSEVQDKMLEHAERVVKNVVVLTKHQIPLELTLEQSEIYYLIEPQDLEDLLNIITTDDEGNGMGFSIDFVYYCLNELAHIDVDKLIDVYNDEFMNVNAKSGIISLLKKTNDSLGNFENNRKMNIATLESLGIETANKIAEEYPEFIDLDNPLFINALNLFDKDDLVEKLNSDTSLVPKILDYWKNN